MMVLDGIAKRFDGDAVLDGVDLSVAAGEMHGIVGENGTGKTVLASIMSGAFAPDGGRILVDGQAVRFRSPRDALRLGIAAVPQGTYIADGLSVAENLFAARSELRPRGFLARRRSLVREAAILLSELGLDLDPARATGSLNLGQRQIVKIASALAVRPRLLILDEPFVNLSRRDAARIMDRVRDLKDRGTAVVYISHDTEDILRECGRVTMLGDGRASAAVDADTPDREGALLGRMGIGRNFAYPKIPCGASRVVLRVAELRTAKGTASVTFSLHKGEILGIAGKLGAGKSSVARAIYGIDRIECGSVLVDGRPFRPCCPRDALRLKIGYLPEDRIGEWLLADRGIPENVTLVNPYEVHRRLALRRREELYVVGRCMKSLKIKAPRTDTVIADLSGGNQQKVAIAKLLFSNARILMLDEPTKELDSSTKIEVYNLMAKSAGEGVSIIFISSDERELRGMCDRILVMEEGKILSVLVRRSGCLRSGISGGEWEPEVFPDSAGRTAAV